MSMPKVQRYAPHVAALGLVAAVVVLVWQSQSFVVATLNWARRDLVSRTQLTARMLDEPLRTQNFPRLHDIGAACAQDGFRLCIRTGGKGVFFDNRAHADAHTDFQAEAPCGDYRVCLSLAATHVLRPLFVAMPVFVLAFLVGVAGMWFVFVALYRQRVRIRELTRLEEFRRAFIADFSHELKTPLTGILGAADMLGGDDPLVGMIKKESKRLNVLAQQVLDLARLERTGESLVRNPTDVRALLADACLRFTPSAQQVGLRLTVAPSSDQPLVVSVDERLVAQALDNLVSNAIRHSGGSEVILAATLSGHSLEFTVTDNGRGIPSDERMRVFERFHRVDPSRAASSGGAGLGLAIVQRIARLHGGDASVAAVQPHGCCFTLRLGV